MRVSLREHRDREVAEIVEEIHELDKRIDHEKGVLKELKEDREAAFARIRSLYPEDGDMPLLDGATVEEDGCPDNNVHMITEDTGRAIDLETGQVFPLAGEAVVVYDAELVLRRKP